MKTILVLAIGASLVSLGGMALAAPPCSMSMVKTCGQTSTQDDKYALKEPNGFSFADIKGYENWPNVAVSHVEDGLKIILANPTMIDAYREGIPVQRQTLSR